MTNGRNQLETSPHNKGKGLKVTAEKKKTAATKAAVLSPNATAIVLIF